ncbi:hypothetical protein L7F22_032185 [Adiantum nelumboides]|nr:hypothetical protein [Adiantum nelumboides]
MVPQMEIGGPLETHSIGEDTLPDLPPPSEFPSTWLPLDFYLSAVPYLVKMDEGVQKLQQDLSTVEYEAEVLLLARQKLVESDKVRNGNREALTALRKIARTSQTSVPMLNSETIESGKDDAVTDCRTCGDYDRSEPLWFLSAGGDFFMNLPFHEAHLKLEMEQKQLDITVNKLHSKVKDQTLSLSEKGALADKIGPSILKSLVTLKDNS